MKYIDRKPVLQNTSPVSISRKETGLCNMLAAVDPVLFFQRTVGNQTVQRVFQSGRQGLAAKQHDLIRLQRVRHVHRRSPVPGLSSMKLHTFLNDLNTIIYRSFGKQASLNVNDFSFLTSVQFLHQLKTSSPADYSYAYNRAVEVCAARSNRQFQKICGSDRGCIRHVLNIQKNRRMCNQGIPADILIAPFMDIAGLTLPGKGRSLINLGMPGTPKNRILETIVHEGLHRLRGRIWAQRSRIGLGAYHSIHRRRLSHIKKKLDEGTVQILTREVIRKMRGISGRNWFRGYSSSSYVQEIHYVQGILGRHNKNMAFLVKAYFSNAGIREVEDLQFWQ